MDRSFLFDADVIKASRNFVCIRAATYEDEDEAEFLKTIFVGREGELDNTVFTMLSPDTKEFLCTPGRGPDFAFRTASQMATAMDKFAIEFPAQERPVDSAQRLPELKNFGLGLNVCACDGLPLVVCFGKDPTQVETLKKKLAPMAFEETLAGKFVFASTHQAKDLSVIKELKSKPPEGYLLIQSDAYGLEGELVEAIAADASDDKIKTTLTAFANKTGRVSKIHNQHVRTGNQTGKNWETEIPVTDPDSLRAMQRRKK